jgi:hypothetical protein
VLVLLLARPRLVIYNISSQELRAVLADAAARIDPEARWAGNHLTLPRLDVHLHLDSFDVMRNVSLVSSGSQQSIDGWRRLARELRQSLSSVRTKRSPRVIALVAVSLVLLAVSVTQMLNRPEETLQAMNEVFAY